MVINRTRAVATMIHAVFPESIAGAAAAPSCANPCDADSNSKYNGSSRFIDGWLVRELSLISGHNWLDVNAESRRLLNLLPV